MEKLFSTPHTMSASSPTASSRTSSNQSFEQHRRNCGCDASSDSAEWELSGATAVAAEAAEAGAVAVDVVDTAATAAVAADAEVALLPLPLLPPSSPPRTTLDAAAATPTNPTAVTPTTSADGNGRVPGRRRRCRTSHVTNAAAAAAIAVAATALGPHPPAEEADAGGRTAGNAVGMSGVLRSPS
jgi:hypothetical protein